MTVQEDKQGSSRPDGVSPPEGPSLAARMEERFFAPFKRNAFAHRTWFLVTLAGIVLLHAAVLAALLYRDRSEPLGLPPPEETPVEVVVEPPKPPEPQKQAEQKPPPEQEKPASSAPREANDEKVDTTQTAKDTHAPKAPTPPTEGQPDAAAAASSPSDTPAPPDKPDEARAAAPDKDAEALDKAVPLPPKRPDLPKPKPPARTQVAKTALQRLAGTSELHDFTFARPTKKSPIAGGTEDSRYLAIIFGMIMSNRRAFAVPDLDGDVTVAFDVDDGGNVIHIGIVRPSGYPQIDAEAVGAIRRASPFPAPPAGSPHSLIATVGFGGPATQTGRRVQ